MLRIAKINQYLRFNQLDMPGFRVMNNAPWFIKSASQKNRILQKLEINQYRFNQV